MATSDSDIDRLITLYTNQGQSCCVIWKMCTNIRTFCGFDLKTGTVVVGFLDLAFGSICALYMIIIHDTPVVELLFDILLIVSALWLIVCVQLVSNVVCF